MPRKLQPERRREILAAARELFATRGYQDTNVADVAIRLRMGHGTVYRYFKNKRDIFAQIIDEIVGTVTRIAIAEAPGQASSLADYRGQIERIGARLYRIFADDPHAMRLVFEVAHSVDQDMRDRLDAAFEGIARFTAAYLGNGRDRGFLRADLDLDVTARALNAVVIEGIRRCARATDLEAEAARWVAIILKLQFEGLAAPAPPSVAAGREAARITAIRVKREHRSATSKP
jgi:AcrR family transcriptional regulator